jgi:predicted amidohydrolase YtcJ
VVIAAWEPNIPNVMAFNSMALQRLGITREHPDRVEGVIIEKDAQGEPTGRLVGAVNATYSSNQFAYGLWRKLPIDHSKIPLPALKQAIDYHHSMGVTGIYENHNAPASH